MRLQKTTRAYVNMRLARSTVSVILISLQQTLASMPVFTYVSSKNLWQHQMGVARQAE